MGRYTGTAPLTPSITFQDPIGSVSHVVRSGANYKAVGELVQRSIFPALSAAFPRNGSFNSVVSAIPPIVNLNAVAFGNNTFVAVGGASGANSVTAAYSSDGVNWYTTHLPGTGVQWVGVTYGAGLFVAIAASGEVVTSPDGVVWTSQTALTGAGWVNVFFGGTTFVATASGNKAASSTNGTAWTARVMPSSTTWLSIAWNGTIFLAYDGGTSAASSPDGATWTAQSVPTAAPGGLVWGAGLFVVGGGNTVILTSATGLTGSWTQRSLGHGVTKNPTTITYGNGVFICSNASVTPGVMISYDGINWKQKTVGTGMAVNSLGCSAYGNGVAVFFQPYSGGVPAEGIGCAIYAENLVDSDYMYLSGTPGNFVRVQ